MAIAVSKKGKKKMMKRKKKMKTGKAATWERKYLVYHRVIYEAIEEMQ